MNKQKPTTEADHEFAMKVADRHRPGNKFVTNDGSMTYKVGESGEWRRAHPKKSQRSPKFHRWGGNTGRVSINHGARRRMWARTERADNV